MRAFALSTALLLCGVASAQVQPTGAKLLTAPAWRRNATKPAPALAILSPPGAGYDTTGGGLTTGSGAAVTVSRTSEQRCADTTGAIRTIAANKPCVTNAGALLVEPAATNLLLQSDDFATSWAANGAHTITANTWDYGTGSATGDTFDDTDTAAIAGRYQSVIVTATNSYTLSCHAQMGTFSKLRLGIENNGGSVANIACVHTLTGTTGRYSCGPLAYTYPAAWAASTAYAFTNLRRPITINNRYYEVTTAGTSAATEPAWPTTTGATVTDGTVVWTDRGETRVYGTVYVSDVGADTGSIKVGGCQLETGSTRTSYIPTTTATASRAAQTSNAGAVTVGAAPSFAATVNLVARTASTGGFWVQALNSATDRWNLRINPSGTLVCEYYNGTAYAHTTTATVPVGAETKVSCGYDGTNMTGCVGNTCTSSALAFTPSASFSSFYVGTDNSSGSPGAITNGTLHSIRACRTPAGCR